MASIESIISRGINVSVTDYDAPSFRALNDRFDTLQGWAEEQEASAFTPRIIAAAEKLVADLVAAEWGCENTIARRAAWNQMATNGVAQWEIEEALFCTAAQLKAAIVANGL